MASARVRSTDHISKQLAPNKETSVKQKEMGMNKHMEEAADSVRIVSRRTIQPRSPRAPEDIHLTPWDLCLLTIDYIQKGVLLPKPAADPAGGGGERLVDALASSLALALDRFYPLAGRLVMDDHRQVPADDGTTTVLLRCAGQGAELVHATAPGAAAADIVGSVHTPSSLVWALFPLNQVVGADAAVESLPLLSAQVTELADGAVFIGVSMNHSAGDGTAFWEFFNTWSEINRRGSSSPRPVHQQRWFTGTSPVPIAMPFSNLQHVVRRFRRPAAVAECFFTFSAASIKKLKARANHEIEMAGAGAIISSLQALLAHLWRAVCRARRARPEQEASYSMLVGCRGRVSGIPEGYMGNAVTFGKARSTAGEILGNGLGWAALQLNRVVASFDEASVREWLGRWARDPRFVYNGDVSSGGTALATGSSPRFDVFGNDFGWGKPVAVRSGSGNKIDGKATVFQGPEEQGGSMSLEVCVAPDVLDRLVNDVEFMDAVSVPT